ENLCQERFSDSARTFESALRDFNRRETGARGAGYAARLAALHRQHLQPIADAIFQSLREVHARFGFGVSEDVKQDFLQLAGQALEGWIKGQEGAYTRCL